MQPWHCDSQKTQHSMSEVLRLPCKSKMDTAKVLRLQRKMDVIF